MHDPSSRDRRPTRSSGLHLLMRRVFADLLTTCEARIVEGERKACRWPGNGGGNPWAVWVAPRPYGLGYARTLLFVFFADRDI